MSLPKQLAAKSKSFDEKNDCAVKAVAVVANASYEEAYEALRKAGRKPRRATPLPVIFAALKSLGCHATYQNNFQHNGVPMGRCPISRVKSRLMQAFGANGKQFRNGRYLVLTRNHILAVKDGEVQDWTDGRRHQARFAWEVSL